MVTAASYEVRAFGVRSGMPIAEAFRLAPHAIYLPGRLGTYGPYSKRVRAVIERYAPVVQAASIDEFYLDLRGCERLYRQPGDLSGDHTIARVVGEMRVAIDAEIGLPASVGIGSTRAVAKIASALAKPAGVFLVPGGREREVLGGLPARKFPGIGPVAERRLWDAGVETIEDLLSMPPGPERGRLQRLLAMVERGIDGRLQGPLGRERPAFHEHDPEGVKLGSISNERTFSADVGDVAAVRAQVAALVERVCWRARKRGIRARTVSVKLRYSDFETLSRSRTIRPTHEEEQIRKCALALFDQARTRDLPVRLVGVTLSNLMPAERQLSLPFDAPHRPHVGAAIDRVRQQFGYNALRLGAAAGGEDPASRWRESL